MGFGSSSECYGNMHFALAVGLFDQQEFDRLERSLLPARKELYRLIQAIDRRTGR
jgi:hypothetical protein